MRKQLSTAAFLVTVVATLPALAQQPTLLTGQDAFTDWNQQTPGVRHKITIADLPAPNPDEAVNNTAHIVPKPTDAWPTVPVGFKVELYAGGDNAPMQRADNTEHMARANGTFTMPRYLMTAPNGDIFLADSGAGTIIVLRGTNPDGKATTISTFAEGLDHPFGIAFYPAANPQWVYVGNATTIVRFPYKTGDLKATAGPQTLITVPGYAQLTGGGHWTRDVVFTADGKHMLVSVGSGSNVSDPDEDYKRDGSGRQPKELHRADVLEYTPDGKFEEVYATGIRNCVGEAISPATGALWCSTNERDNLGNHLVPDYVTSVPEHSFFGWPWYYMGGKHDPRLPDPCANGTGPNPQRTTGLTEQEAANCKRKDLSKKVRTPDVLVQPHMASLEMTFYPNSPSGAVRLAYGMPPKGEGTPVPNSNKDMAHSGPTPAAKILYQPFPAEYRGGIFAAEHGSWNRKNRAGYNVIFIPTVNGKATGEYDDFLDGFVTKDGQVWGRPVGVTVGKDGSLFVTDDGSRSVWHITYTGK